LNERKFLRKSSKFNRDDFRKFLGLHISQSHHRVEVKQHGTFESSG